MKYAPIYLIAGSLLLAVVGYSAAAWYAGEQVEAALAEQSKALQDVFPLVKLGDRQYDRGLFSSEETVAITLTAKPRGEPLHFTLTSKIRHLPFLGMLDLDAAAIDSRISVNEDSRKEVSEWVGDKLPVAIHTVLHFGGAGKTLVTITQVNTSRLSSGEASLAINFGEKLATYSMKVDFTNIEIKDKAVSLIQASGLHFDDDHKRVFPDEPGLYTGSAHLSMDRFAFSLPRQSDLLVINQLKADQATGFDKSSGLVSFSSKLDMKAVTVADQDYGPAVLDMSLHNLDAHALVNLNHAIKAANGNNVGQGIIGHGLVRKISPLILDLIKHDPEFRIDRVSYTSPEGESRISALVKFSDVQPDDLSNGKALLDRLYILADIKIPEATLTTLTRNGISHAGQSVGGVTNKIAQMIAMGYLTSEAGNIKTHLEFRNGNLSFNGKKFTPRTTPVVPNISPLRRPAGGVRAQIHFPLGIIAPSMKGRPPSQAIRAGGVFRCTDVNGQTTYTDKPCAPNEKMHKMPTIATPAQTWPIGIPTRGYGADMFAGRPYSRPRTRAEALMPLIGRCTVTRYNAWVRANSGLTDIEIRAEKLHEFNQICRGMFHVR